MKLVHAAFRTALLMALLALATGCSISRHVVPVESATQIEKIHVLHNDRVHMEGLNDALVEIFQSLGFDAELFEGDRPPGALHTFTFTANWAWDMAMYLTYFRGTLLEDGRIIGEVEYDARSGGSNMSKFGSTESKIQPLIAEMLGRVQ
ncbi:MAG: Sbal_3080 family lipoprotein [Wenzhouxiangella sp.]|nr:Sbal_3080 family lipoprotein [Wenzhouxiangella sp.]